MRALAIALVILSHRLMQPGMAPGIAKVGALVQPGVIGVRLFFIISGFLITTLLLAELESTQTIALGRFYLRRTLRLLPPLLVLVAALVVLDRAGLITLHRGDLLYTLTYTSNFHLGRSWYVGHAWTLAIEEQFYLAWPALLLLLRPWRARRAALFALAIGPLVKLTLYVLTPPAARDGIASTFWGVSDTLVAGCALALLRPQLHAMPRYRALIASPLFIAVAPLVAVACWSAGGHWRLAIATQLVSVLLFTMCLDRVITLPGAATTRVLDFAPIAWLGRVSYGIYLWQQLFTAPDVRDRWQSLALTSGPASYAAILAAAVLSFYLVERPSLRLRDHVERRLHDRSMREQQELLAQRVATEGAM